MSEQVSVADESARLADLVDRIRRGDRCADEELYRMLREGISFLLSNELGRQDADDKLHDVYVIVHRAITDGRLRNPKHVLAYIRSVARRQVVTEIRQYVKRREREVQVDTSGLSSGKTPEQDVVERERADIMKRVLLELTPKYREILTRYYVLGETEQQISAEMRLTATQFRLLKWRAKARFTLLVRKSLNIHSPSSASGLEPAGNLAAPR